MSRKKGMGKLRGAGTLSKSQEKDILANAKRLRKDWTLMVPHRDPAGDFGFLDPLLGAEKALMKVARFADDEAKLERLARSGHDWAKAWAATVLLSHAGKIPLVARARTPYGDAQVAMRGSARKELLILAQHFDDPKLRLVGVMNMARKKGYHFFSTNQKLICTGKNRAPPDEFIDAMIERLRFSFKQTKGICHCPHLEKKDLKGDGDLAFLEIEWTPAGRTFSICRRCTKTGKNTLIQFLTHMAVPRPRDDFVIRIRGAVDCVSDCKECPLESDFPSEDLVDKYLAGLGDKEFINEHTATLRKRLKEGGEKVYMIENKCFGGDLDKFVSALSPNEEESIALKAMLPKIEGPILLSSPTAANILKQYWKEYGTRAINSIVKDKELAKEIFSRFDVNKTSPSQILKEALIAARQRDIIDALPNYRKLPGVARFADKVARAYKTGGKEEAVRAVEKYKSDDSHTNAVSYAILVGLGHNISKKWHYTDTERDFAVILKEPAMKLLEADPKDYNKALQALLRATGSTEEIKPEG